MRSAIITVVRCVLARGTSGMIEASITRKPSTPITRQSGSTTAYGIVHRPHAARSDDVIAVGALLHKPLIELRVGRKALDASWTSAEGIPNRHVFNNLRECGMPANLKQLPDAFPQPDKIALVREHALFDDRIDAGSGDDMRSRPLEKAWKTDTTTTPRASASPSMPYTLQLAISMSLKPVLASPDV